jgi:homoprotocatechuate degradation regulator HpaR
MERAVQLEHPNLPRLLLQSRERMLSYFRPILNAHGVTEQQWRIIRVLLEGPPLEPRRLCELCCISSPSLVGVLTRMEQMKLIVREAVPHDQRRVLVKLTPRARALGSAMAPEIEAEYARIAGRVGKAFVRQLQETLEHLLAALEPAGAEETFTPDAYPARGRGRRAQAVR